ncbi:MAG: hypothetical protein N3A54_05290 [Patescibacteria group bacterium]|nr:hypothetical protein [Patescibacteria group bacterium]
MNYREFIEKINLLYIDRLSTKPPILVDIKGIFDKKEASALGIIYWRL